jgi:energy-coupling factor transporter transmembrane protein EcfT
MQSATNLAHASFLRRADPRAKLALSLAASLTAMLPLSPLAFFLVAYVAFAVAAGLGAPMAARVRRIAFLLVAVFAVDWLVVGPAFAVLVTLRLVLLVTAFDLLFATTTADELRVGLERLRVPARVAFAFATAFASLALFEDEWRGIVEAQRARGLLPSGSGRFWPVRRAAALPLMVPAVVLVTHRAWSIHEAAAARGFDSPLRRRPREPRLGGLDRSLLTASAVLVAALFVWG